jgi:hypothetical protein
MASKDLKLFTCEEVAKVRHRTCYVRGPSSNIDITTQHNKPDDLVRVSLCSILLAESDTCQVDYC